MEAANPGDSGHRQRGGRWGTRKGERAAPFGARGASGEGRMRAVGGGQSGGGGGARRRGCSGGVEAAWSGRGASPRHEGAIGGVDLGREKAEEGARR